MKQNDWGSTREPLIRYILLQGNFCDDICLFSILEPPFRVTLSHIWSNKLMFPSGSMLLAGTLSTDTTWSLHHKTENVLGFRSIRQWHHWLSIFLFVCLFFCFFIEPFTNLHLTFRHKKGHTISHIFTGLHVYFSLSCFYGKHQHVPGWSLF